MKPPSLPLISQIYADKPQNNKIALTSPICLSLRNNAACCIPLRDLRHLRENIHMRVLNLLAQIKPQKSPADLADLRRQNTNTKTTIPALLAHPSPICLSLRNNTACCIPLRHLRHLRENIHVRVLKQFAQRTPLSLPQISQIYADKQQT